MIPSTNRLENNKHRKARRKEIETFINSFDEVTDLAEESKYSFDDTIISSFESFIEREDS